VSAEAPSLDGFGVALLLVISVLAVIALLLFLGSVEVEYEEKDEERQKASRAELKRKEAELEAEFSRKREEFEQNAQATVAQAIADVRTAAEERFRGSLSADNLEGVDRKLREAQLMFSRTGRVLTVRVFAVPAGWVGIEWMLDPKVPNPLKVVCRRNGKVVSVEHAYKGLHTDLLLRGKEFTFSLQAFEGDRQYEDGLEFVVKIPTPGQWERKVGGTPEPPRDDAAERRQKIVEKVKGLAGEDELWENGRREGHQQIDATEAADLEKRRRKARLDAQIAKERDKADEGESAQ
jgi:hypothetical protein